MEINTADLLNSLNILYPLTARNTILPIFQCALLQPKEDHLTITTSNQITTVSLDIPASNIDVSPFAIPCKKLLEITKLAQTDSLTISTPNDLKTTISTPTANFTLNTLSILDFPQIPQPPSTPVIPIPSDMFPNIYNKILFAASKDGIRPALNSVLINPLDNTLELTASDGYRLATLLYPDPIPLPEKILIPYPSLTELYRLLNSNNPPDHLLIDDRFLFLSSQNTNITILLPNSNEFPNISNILKIPSPYSFSVNANTLKNTLKRASIFTTKTNRVIKLSILPESISISINTELGSFDESIPISTNPPETHFRLNVFLLSEALIPFYNSDINISFSQHDKPIFFQDPNNKAYTNLLMPIKQ